MIQINGKIRLTPDAPAEAMEALVAMVRASRAEDGCLDYSFAQDMADPDTLILFERWRDEAALMAHSQSTHMAEFRQVMAANPPLSLDIRRYETDEGTAL